MAPGPQDPLKTKEELIAGLERSRRALARDLPALGRALNPAESLKRSLFQHPSVWVAGSAIAGLVGTRILLGSRKGNAAHPERREGKIILYQILGFVVKTALTAAAPAAEKLVRDRLARIAE